MPHSMPPEWLATTRCEFEQLLSFGYIWCSGSCGSSALHVVPKREPWDCHPCDDYHTLYAVTIQEQHVIAHISSFASNFHDANTFSEISPIKVYHQVPVELLNSPKSALWCPYTCLNTYACLLGCVMQPGRSSVLLTRRHAVFTSALCILMTYLWLTALQKNMEIVCNSSFTTWLDWTSKFLSLLHASLHLTSQSTLCSACWLRRPLEITSLDMRSGSNFPEHQEGHCWLYHSRPSRPRCTVWLISAYFKAVGEASTKSCLMDCSSRLVSFPRS